MRKQSLKRKTRFEKTRLKKQTNLLIVTQIVNSCRRAQSWGTWQCIPSTAETRVDEDITAGFPPKRREEFNK